MTTRTTTLTASGAKVPVNGTNHAALTPSNTDEFAPCNLYVGTKGIAYLKLLNSSEALPYYNLEGFVPLLVVQVLSTGTTAENIIKLY